MNAKSPSSKGSKMISLGTRTSSSNIQKALVPPVLHEVSKLAAGVAAVSAATGSATGNPRNKCSLQPGHSLMDWIRLGSSGVDLTGVGSKAGHLSITPKELAEHNKESDIWLAIRGKVFNVTRYLPFHPGGPDELMKGAGKDATELFEQVHPWVNYESILQKCYLGRLSKLDPSVDVESLFNPPPKKTVELSLNNKVSPANETATTTTTTTSANTTSLPPTPSTDEQAKEPAKEPAASDEPVQLPRFDWIQKMDYITAIFYTKPLINPQVEIAKPNGENVVKIRITYDHRTFVNDIRFNKMIVWPCHTKINYETGKVEVVFKKVDGQIWDTYGTLKQTNEEYQFSDIKYKYNVVNKLAVNHNTCLLELERVDGNKITVPIGKHVRVFAKIKGEEMSRSYTPVPSSLFSIYKPQNYTTDNVCLMVKSYSNGNVSKYICNRNKDDVMELSKPLGTFALHDLENKDIYLMLAAGTGITPMLSLLLFVLERRNRRSQRVLLMFFNKTEEDLLFKNQLDALKKDDNRFTVEYVLSQPNAKWKGKSGRITAELLNDTVDELIRNTIHTKNDIYFTVCGPTPFTKLSQSLLRELAIGDEQMHLFVG